MAEMMQFRIGADVSCSDGVCGVVGRVVVDPVARAVTHLVVEPKHQLGLGRLVPLELVDATTTEVRLRCSAAEFDKLDAAEETHFLQPGNGYEGYEPGQTFAWPYYPIGGLGLGGMGYGGMGSVPEVMITEKVPLGEVDVHRGDQVQATDGDIGRVQGLVVDPRDHHVTHVLLQEGHLWGRKQVAIPISAVTRVDTGIQLNITKQEVQDLPPVNIEHPVG